MVKAEFPKKDTPETGCLHRLRSEREVKVTCEALASKFVFNRASKNHRKFFPICVHDGEVDVHIHLVVDGHACLLRKGYLKAGYQIEMSHETLKAIVNGQTIFVTAGSEGEGDHCV